MSRETTDQTRVEFLLALDASEEIEVTEWEGDFLESFMNRPDCRAARFSEPQRKSIDGMMRTYGHRLKVGTFNIQHSTLNVQMPESRRGECAWLVRGLTGQERCGLPARKINALGLELCKAHEQQRNEEILRRKKAKR